jgi:CHAD domain-containing protein
VKAKPVALTPQMTTAAAFQAIGRGCLHHLMANEAVLRARRDPDAVHQMRVAMRRLRAAISLFGEVVADDARDPLKDELRWISGKLGEARDLDVFLAKTLAPLRERHPEASELGELAASLEARRDEAYGQALAAVTSPRFLALTLDAAAWIEDRGVASGRRADRGVDRRFRGPGVVAPRQKGPPPRRGTGTARPGDAASGAHRHQEAALRGEFFSRLFEGKGRAKRLKGYLAGLARLQETLGDLNDMAVSQASPPAWRARAPSGRGI